MSTQTLPYTQTSEIISYDPSTGEEIGRVPLMDAADVRSAVIKARSAQSAWSRLSYRERARFILRAREIVLNEVDPIANLVSRETGRTGPNVSSLITFIE